jgi:hypothetical protein
MLPDTKASDYRVTVAGTNGYIDLIDSPAKLTMTNADEANIEIGDLPERTLVVRDWLNGGDLVPQEASLRANRLALAATLSARTRQRVVAD